MSYKLIKPDQQSVRNRDVHLPRWNCYVVLPRGKQYVPTVGDGREVNTSICTGCRSSVQSLAMLQTDDSLDSCLDDGCFMYHSYCATDGTSLGIPQSFL